MPACVLIGALLIAGCASTQPASSASKNNGAVSSTPGKPAPRAVKSRDGSFDGEVVGTAVPGSKFADLQIGMQRDEVQQALGRMPDRSHTYETGKRWIPYYFGNDSRRMQVLYKGEGCLIFTAGNNWGGAGGDLIQIEHDASGACYAP